MKLNEICQEFKGLTINEIAINPFIAEHEKHEITVIFYYPNIKKLSVYMLSMNSYKVSNVDPVYTLKVINH
jgi:hypothetical protein